MWDTWKRHGDSATDHHGNKTSQTWDPAAKLMDDCNTRFFQGSETGSVSIQIKFIELYKVLGRKDQVQSDCANMTACISANKITDVLTLRTTAPNPENTDTIALPDSIKKPATAPIKVRRN